MGSHGVRRWRYPCACARSCVFECVYMYMRVCACMCTRICRCMCVRMCARVEECARMCVMIVDALARHIYRSKHYVWDIELLLCAAKLAWLRRRWQVFSLKSCLDTININVGHHDSDLPNVQHTWYCIYYCMSNGLYESTTISVCYATVPDYDSDTTRICTRCGHSP